MTRSDIAEGRKPNEPLGAECGHKVAEDCMVCAICGRCREDLDEEDICTECGGTKEC
jgi:hypothetical protein